MNRTLLEKELRQADYILPIPLAKSALPTALVINLDSEASSEIEISQTFLNKYVGGPALAARLWACFVDTASDNPIVITGSSSGSLVTVAFKSPVTENLTFNTFSGRFNLNYCAVIIVGKLRKYGITELSNDELHFNLDERLRHTSTLDISNFYPGCISTGEAANNGLVYASAVCNENITGRGGLGFVMNQKNLKAICLGILPTSRDTFDFSSFVKNATANGWAPVDNITKRTDPRLFHLCADEKTRKLGEVYISCQAILMLGSNVGCFDIESVYSRYIFCLEKGLDPVSVGNILGWIREAQERGIVAFERPVDFSDNNQVLSLMDSIVNSNKGFEIFAEGVKASAKYYKNSKYSKEINGLECGPYDYRGTIASSVNDALGNWFPVYFDLIPGLTIKDKSGLVLYNEELVMGLQCMNINPDVVVPMLINKLSKIKKILINNNVIGFEKVLNTEELNITDVFTVGQNCRYIVRKVNSILKNNKPSIPDYFCVDPESNSPDETIVNFRKILTDYSSLLAGLNIANSHR